MSATIVQLNQAMASGKLTTEKLVSMYLKHIEAYDKQGPNIKAVILVNPNSLICG